MKKNKRIIHMLSVGVVKICFISASFAQKSPAVIPVDPQVKVGTLSNGLTYYIRKNAEPANRAELYLVVKAGSNQEDDDQQGLAHFTEHMAFNGTKDFPKNQLVDYLQKSGVRFGADLNAYTSFDETVYQLPLPTDDPVLFTKGFTILANWAGHVSFDPEEIEKERGIIVEEDRLRGKDAGERMRKQIFPVIFHNSRYADRLPIGKMDIVKSFKHQTIKRFYQQWYRPDLQAVIAVGDFDIAMVEDLIKKNFSGLTNPKKEKARITYTIPMNPKPLVKVVTDSEFSYTVGYIIFKKPARSSRTTKDLYHQAIVEMVNQMFEARLQEIMEGGKAPFVHASGTYGPYYGGLGDANAFFMTTVAKEPETMKDAVTGLVNEVMRVNKFGFTTSELSRAKQNFLAGLEKKYNERKKTSSSHFVKEYVQHFTKGIPIPGIEYLYRFYSENLPHITLDQVNDVAQSITQRDHCVAILEGLESNRTKLPDETTYLSWIQNAGRDVSPYIDNALDKPLLSSLPAPGKIVSERKIESLQATEIKLSNGITVILKPTDFKQDEIIFTAASPGGTSLSTEKEYLSASIAADVIKSSGVASYDKSQLAKMLSGKMVNVSPYIDQHYEGIYGSATPKDIATAFQLIYLYFTQPRLDSNAFKMLRDSYKVNVAARASFPNAVYQDTISAIMGGYHKRSTVPSVKAVEALDLQTAFNFYKERFSDASDLAFSFVGNFTIEDIKPHLEMYLASLPVAGRKESYRDLNIRPAVGKTQKNVFKGLEDKASVSLFLHDDYTYNEDNNLMLDALTAALKIKLIERLREKESGVYTPAVNVRYTRTPQATYTFHIAFSCASENVEKLINATHDEIEDLRKNGVSATDLEKFKAEEIRQVEIRLRDNNFWLHYLNDVYVREEDADNILHYTIKLKAINQRDTKTAAEKFLNDRNLKRIVLLPEHAATQSPN